VKIDKKYVLPFFTHLEAIFFNQKLELKYPKANQK
jgi:hypothetical protein